jgi:hypothetical protein
MKEKEHSTPWSSFVPLSVLALCWVALAVLSVAVPQGQKAIRMASLPGGDRLRALAAAGLTDVMDSPWLWATAVLSVAVLAAHWIARPRSHPMRASSDDPNWPEEILVFDGIIGFTLHRLAGVLPRSWRRVEVASGPDEQVFRTGLSRQSLFWMTLASVFFMSLGVIGWSGTQESGSSVVAKLKVTDSRTGTQAVFNLPENEPIDFFEWGATWELVAFVEDWFGQGPAARFRTVYKQERQQSLFWVFADAPPEFDRRHRRGLVDISILGIDRIHAVPSTFASHLPVVLLLVGVVLGLWRAALLFQPSGWVKLTYRDHKLVLLGTSDESTSPRFTRQLRDWGAHLRDAMR